MRIHTFSFFALAGSAAYVLTLSAGAQNHQHNVTEPTAAQGDARQLVKLPEPMRLHTVSRMRDHRSLPRPVPSVGYGVASSRILAAAEHCAGRTV